MSKPPSALSLILFEFPGEVEEFLQYCNQNQLEPDSFLPVALFPKARVLCVEKNLHCIDTLEFFNNQSHTRAACESHRIMERVKEHLAFSDSLPLKNTLMDTFIYYARFYINNYLKIFEILKGIRQVYPDAVFYTVEKPREILSQNNIGEPFLTSNDLFLSSIVEKFCLQNGLKFQLIPRTTPPNTPKLPTKTQRPSIPGDHILKKTARKLLFQKLKSISRNPVVFLAAPSYNLDRVGKTIETRFPQVRVAAASTRRFSSAGYIKWCLRQLVSFFPPLKDKSPLTSIPLDFFETPVKDNDSYWEDLKQSFRQFLESFGGEMVYEGCSYREEFTGKVEADLLKYLAYLCRMVHHQESILQFMKPRILLSPVSMELFQSWAEVCRRFHIPSIVIPQKGLVAPSNEYARIEEHYIGMAQVTDDFDYTAAQSPLVAQYLQWSGYKGKVLETGNLALSKIKCGAREEKIKTLVYAPSMKSRKSCRFYVLESLDELMASIRDVAAACAQLPDTRLIIRLHPGEPITRKEIESLLELPPNVSISDKGTFEEVLSTAHLVISYSSTSIQEALLNGVPVVLYDRWKRYNHLDVPRVENRHPGKLAAAYYIDEPSNLSSSLRWILDNHEHLAKPYELFKEYVYPARCAESFFQVVKKCCEQGWEEMYGIGKGIWKNDAQEYVNQSREDRHFD